MAKRQVLRLSTKQVAGKLAPGFHADGLGLYLQVSPTLTKSWVFRYKRHGETTWMGLGSASTFSLAEARERAQAARKLLADGIDPRSDRDATRAAVALLRAQSNTFDDCADKYIKAHRASWRSAKHAEQWRNSLLTHASPTIGSLSISDIDTGLILRVLEPIWTSKHETATRVRGRIERIIDWATTRGYRKGENPARWRGHLEHNLASISKSDRVKHHPAMPFDDVPAFFQRLRSHSSLSAVALQLTILTVPRTSEIIAATPKEFDLDAGVWSVPAVRMKGKRDHRIPLAAPAVRIVKDQLKDAQHYVFPGKKPGTHLSNMAMLELLRGMGLHYTVHGFRSSFRDWAAERTSYPREVCEMALAHAISDETEAAYRRGDLFEKRRRLMNEWAKFLETTAREGIVTPLRQKGNTV